MHLQDLLLLFLTFKFCFYLLVCTRKRSIICSLCNQKSVKLICCRKIQMYQLSRLLHDYHRDLHCHLEQQDIAPSLYAPPWFLTTFASQYPLGFVARVFGEFGGNRRISRNVYKILNQDTDDRRQGILLFSHCWEYHHTHRCVCSKCILISYTAKVGR